MSFQHTAARRRLAANRTESACSFRFNTQPPEGGWDHKLFHARNQVGFNTQPPEGGWLAYFVSAMMVFSFNTQPPEGGWCRFVSLSLSSSMFQHTAARRRLAIDKPPREHREREFQHTAARRRLGHELQDRHHREAVSTHSRPKAAGLMRRSSVWLRCWFQHTAARRRLAIMRYRSCCS